MFAKRSYWIKLCALFSFPQMNLIQPVSGERMGLEYSLPGEFTLCPCSCSPCHLEDILKQL